MSSSYNCWWILYINKHLKWTYAITFLLKKIGKPCKFGNIQGLRCQLFCMFTIQTWLYKQLDKQVHYRLPCQTIVVTQKETHVCKLSTYQSEGHTVCKRDYCLLFCIVTIKFAHCIEFPMGKSILQSSGGYSHMEMWQMPLSSL